MKMKNLLCTGGAYLKKGLIPLTSGLALIATASLFNNLQAQTIKLDWVNQYAGAGANTSCGDVYKSKTMALDAEGNIYNTGNVNGEADFDPGPGVQNLSSIVNKQNRFLTKSDKDGKLIWAKQFGNAASFTNVNAIDLDSSGNIYLAGYFRDTFDFDPGPNTVNGIAPAASSEIFVIKLDNAGNFIWGKQIGGTSSDYIYGMVVDDAGNIFATGAFSGTVDFDPDATSTFLTGGGAFVLKWNTNGEYVWAKNWASSYGYAIDLDGYGNIYTTGYYSGVRRDFNPSTNAADTFMLSALGSFDIFVSKLDPNGNFLWAKSFGGTKQDQGFSIEVDFEGNSYTTGIFGDTADFDPGSGVYKMVSRYAINAKGDTVVTQEVYVSKLDPSGNFVWANQLHGTGSNWGYSVALGKGQAEGVYATGVYRATAYIYQGNDTTTFSPPTGTSGTYLFKLNPATGNFEWSRQLGAISSGTVVVDTIGNVYAAGWFNSVTTIFDTNHDSISVNRVGTLDGFIIKYKWCGLSDTVTETACMSYEYLGETYVESGSYTVLNPEGCDESSVIVLNLTIFQLDPVISVDEFRLGTTQDYSTYQWLLNDLPIAGATQKDYLVTGNGKYRVVVTNENGCIDTSDAYTVTNYTNIVGTDAVQYINVYPNPARDILYINSPVPVQVSVSSMEGKLVKDVKETRQVTVNDLAEGIYLLHISDKEGKLLKTEKFVKYK